MTRNRKPAFFIGHGSPMNAIEDNEFSRTWQNLGAVVEKPEAILCISAHWETRGAKVTAVKQPRTIHDFYGFPQPLFNMEYPAPGSPELAKRICAITNKANIHTDLDWGLDHGTWSVLAKMYPKADIPTLQLSLDRSQDADFHYKLGRELQTLRDEGVLIIGSGNIVHNLRLMVWEDQAFEWALDFDGKVKNWILERNHDPLIHYDQQGQSAALSINSAEHYLPLLYILGLREADDPVTFYNEKVWGGSLSMRCVQIG